MAISPVVQQHQRSIVQQSSSSEDLSFNKEFGEAAYALLNSKFPRLVPYIVTFKILESGSGKEYGVGTFIVARGDELGYIPVVLQGGKIASCEMIYDKKEETFKPLSAKEVKSILAYNRTREHSLIQKPRTEDTQAVFKNMFRPPSSSDPVLASARLSLDVLPDTAKKALSDYFTENPDVLAKTASFYDPAVLASRLAVSQQEKQAEEVEVEKFSYLDRVIKLDDLTEKTAEMIQEAYPDKTESLITDGYLVTDSEPAKVDTIPSKDFKTSVETAFNAREIGSSGVHSPMRMGNASQPIGPQAGRGNVLKFDNAGYFKQVPCLVFEYFVLGADFKVRYGDTPLVITDFSEGISKDDIRTVMGPDNVVSPCDAAAALSGKKDAYVMYPTRSGSWKKTGSYLSGHSFQVQKVTDSSGRTVTTLTDGYSTSKYTFTPDVEHGKVDLKGSGVTILPETSLLIASSSDPLPERHGFIRTLSSLRTILEQSGTKLQCVQDGPDYNLIDRTFNKTAQFKSKADLVKCAVHDYGMDAEGVALLLSNRQVHLVKKASEEWAMGKSEQPIGNIWSGNSGAQQAEPAESLLVDESLLEGTAGLGDEDLMDTGMVASLANNSDIKGLLVDFVEDFKKTTTELGKAVLVMAINEAEFKDQYGREDYSSIIDRLRSVFTGLGLLVFDLEEYTNNQSFTEGT